MGDYCRTHFKRKETSSLGEIQKSFAQAREGTDSNEENKIFLEKTEGLCKRCRENHSEIPAIFKLVDKIFKLREKV